MSGQTKGVRGVMQSVKERCRLLAVDDGADTVLECGYGEFVTKMAAKVRRCRLTLSNPRRNRLEVSS